MLVAPVPRSSLVLGKVLGGSTLAFMQACLFLLLSPLVGIHLGAGEWARVGAIIFMDAFLLTSLGFLIAWQFQSIQGFHAVMNLLLMPMWILSGALFPADGASEWITWIMKINPLTYAFSALRASLGSSGPVLQPSVIALCAALFFFVLASFMTSRQSVKNLR